VSVLKLLAGGWNMLLPSRVISGQPALGDAVAPLFIIKKEGVSYAGIDRWDGMEMASKRTFSITWQ
jgi:hypothetical protein